MNYIIFDMEWNQPSDVSTMVCQPIFLTGEIIEIGAVKLDDSFQVMDGLKLYIKPRYYQKLHRKIAALTGIRDKVLQEQGLEFPEAMRQFRQWCGEDCTWMTWSTSDLDMLAENLLLHGMDVSELPLYCDLQRIFGREIMREERRHSLEEALEVLGERGEPAHDALQDAKNTALVCKHLDLEDYIGEYVCGVYAEPPAGRLYADRREAAQDADLQVFGCPICGAQGSCEPWRFGGFRGQVALGTCAQAHEFWVRLTTEQNAHGQHQARRMFFDMSEDLWELYEEL